MADKPIRETRTVTFGPPAAPPRLTLMDLLLVVNMVIWATHFSVAKAAVEVLPPFVYNAFRFTIAALTLALIARAAGHRLALPRGRWLPILRVSFVTFVVYQALFMFGLRHTTVANSVLITTVAPIGVVLVNIWRGRERGSQRIYTGIAVAVVGVLVVVLSRYAGQLSLGSTTLLGDLLTAGSAAAWVVATLAQRKMLIDNPVPVANFWMLFWGALFASALAFPELLVFDWAKMEPGIIAAILYAGTIAIAIGATIFAIGLKTLGASRTAVYVNLQPVIAAAVAIIFLGEPFTPWLVVGTALALGGLWLIRRG